MIIDFSSIKKLNLNSWNGTVYGGNKGHVFLNNEKVELSSEQEYSLVLFSCLRNRSGRNEPIYSEKLKEYGIEYAYGDLLNIAYREIDNPDPMMAPDVTPKKVEAFINNYKVKKITDLTDSGITAGFIKASYKTFKTYFLVVAGQDEFKKLSKNDAEQIIKKFNVEDA